jgi:UDP-N-acetylglucosamine 2-epimerase (non-hydrolysing)
MQITIVAGARPNFMKIAPIIKAIKTAQMLGNNIHFRLVHTGQHYDQKMSNGFFDQLGIPNPDNNLSCGGGTQAEQTAAIMIKFEKELQNYRPDVVLVVGDVTSTMACAITAKKLGIDTVHVEAGIRSGDMSMPEEINRMVTDSICDYFFTTSLFANNNLLAHQIPKDKIHFVGNTMVDTLYQNLYRIQQPDFWNIFELSENNYFLLTLHRPSNVDDPEKLALLLNTISATTKNYPVIFPVHPRTRQVLNEFDIVTDNIILIDPQSYLEFIYLIKNAKGIITDSGGITEEATVLNIPCLTMRNSTERPETVIHGTNELVGDDYEKLSNCLNKIINGNWKEGAIPVYWDGRTSERIVDVLLSAYA